METTSCPLCTRDLITADASRLAWTSVHDRNGTVSFICPDCTRDQLTEIETMCP